MIHFAICSDTPWHYWCHDVTLDYGDSLRIQRIGRIFDKSRKQIAEVSSAMDQCIPDTALMGNAPKMLALLKTIRKSKLLPQEWNDAIDALVYEASGQKEVDEMWAKAEKK